MQMNWSLFRMAPNQTLASATTPGTKLDKNLHYYVFIESIEILFHVLIMLIPMPGYEVIFLFETNVDLKSNKINVKEAMEYIAQAWNSVKVEAIVNN
ncbi:hypothetical protein RIR_jg17188.t1 [Rhizophagus irregularis DAOM 181602=DAOM 197198]|nr:hypothetical protein RIR_jg17188.t1 [Rhizophagus irregularis DAOM 181602=DAOM 197198]